jgi:hypothetical protein
VPLRNRAASGDGNSKWFDLLTEGILDYGYLKLSGDSGFHHSLCLLQLVKIPTSFKIRYSEESGCDFFRMGRCENGEISDNCFAYWEDKVTMDRS